MAFERLLPMLVLVAIAVFHKRKKVRHDKKDYITRLPDHILCHIISYLDINDALQASLLSTRWRKLYCTLLPNPNFDFDKMLEFVTVTKDNNFHRDYKQRFVTSVDTFFRLRSDFPMESFTLRFRLMREFPAHLRRWFDCIVTSGVRKLDIDFCCRELGKIPNSGLIVFPFEVLSSVCMLEYVQLSLCILELNFQGPSNSLKELNLSLVPLVNGEVEIILSSCPQLMLLHLLFCKLPCKFLVSALKLRTLKIEFCEQVNEIGFSAPNLDFFDYYGNWAISFSPSYVPKLRKLFLDLKFHNGPPHGFGGFVRDAPCLDCLWIQAATDQVRYIQIEMPMLSNLHTLSLHIIKESLDLREIISMMADCPKLSRFELSTPLCLLSYSERVAKMPPTFVHLKSVALDGFKFEAAQKKFASQLIRYAPALEIMRIYTVYCKYDFGKNVEKTLPLEKRVFSQELISRTKQQLEEQASSSLSIHFYI